MVRRISALAAAAAAALALGASPAPAQLPPKAKTFLNPAPSAPQQPAPPVARADDPAAVTRLRALLGPQHQLDYGSAAEEGAVTRLRRVTLQGRGWRILAAEAELSDVRADGLGRAVLLRAVTEFGLAERIEITGLSLPGREGRLEDLRLDTAEVTGLRLTGALRGAVARIALRGYGAGRETALEATGLRWEPGAGQPVEQATLERVELGVSDLPALLNSAQQARGPQAPQPYTGRIAFAASALELRASGQRLGGLERAELLSDGGGGGRSSGRLALTGIEVRATSPYTAGLRQLGYEALHGDLTLDATQDLPARRLEIGALALSVREAGAIGLAATFDGIAGGGQRPDPSAVALVRGRLLYAEAGLVTRTAEGIARERRVPVAQVRNEWVEMARTALAGSQPGIVAMREPVFRFLRGEAREIEFRADPPRPVRADIFGTPGGLEQRQPQLGLSVTSR